MSDMKQNHRNGPRAESASLSGPYACSSALIRTTSQGQRGMRDVMSGKEKGGPVSPQHLGPDAFLCNEAQLTNATLHRPNPLQTARQDI